MFVHQRTFVRRYEAKTVMDLKDVRDTTDVVAQEANKLLKILPGVMDTLTNNSFQEDTFSAPGVGVFKNKLLKVVSGKADKIIEICHNAFQTEDGKMGGIGTGLHVRTRHELDEALHLAKKKGVSLQMIELARSMQGFKSDSGILLAEYADSVTFNTVKDKKVFLISTVDKVVRPAGDQEDITTLCSTEISDAYRTPESKNQTISLLKHAIFGLKTYLKWRNLYTQPLDQIPEKTIEETNIVKLQSPPALRQLSSLLPVVANRQFFKILTNADINTIGKIPTLVKELRSKYPPKVKDLLINLSPTVIKSLVPILTGKTNSQVMLSPMAKFRATARKQEKIEGTISVGSDSATQHVHIYQIKKFINNKKILKPNFLIFVDSAPFAAESSGSISDCTLGLGHETCSYTLGGSLIPDCGKDLSQSRLGSIPPPSCPYVVAPNETEIISHSSCMPGSTDLVLTTGRSDAFNVTKICGGVMESLLVEGVGNHRITEASSCNILSKGKILWQGEETFKLARGSIHIDTNDIDSFSNISPIGTGTGPSFFDPLDGNVGLSALFVFTGVISGISLVSISFLILYKCCCAKCKCNIPLFTCCCPGVRGQVGRRNPDVPRRTRKPKGNAVFRETEQHEQVEMQPLTSPVGGGATPIIINIPNPAHHATPAAQIPLVTQAQVHPPSAPALRYNYPLPMPPPISPPSRLREIDEK